MRRIILPYLAFFIAGICLYTIGIWILACAVIAALFFLFMLRNKTSFIILSVLFLTLGYLSMGVGTSIRYDTYNRLLEMECPEGMVYDREGSAFTVVNSEKHYKIKLYVSGNTSIVPGDYIFFKGVVREKRAYEIKAMGASGLDAYASCQAYSMEKKNIYKIAMLPVRIRYRLSTGLEKIHPSGGAFISGLVTGQTSGIALDEKEAFSNTGLSHILAVSGFNLGIIFYAVLLVLSKLPKKLRYAICILICLAYVFVTGFQPSITRAFIMVSIASMGVFLRRDYDAVTAISIAAVLMLVYNPYYVYNIGFLLSFSATYGIILLKDDIKERLLRQLDRVGEEASIALSAFIATLPIILYSKGCFSVISLVFNIIISPFIATLTVVSFACSMLYLLSGVVGMLYPAVAAGAVMVRLVKAADNISLMVFPGSPSLIFVFLYYMLIMICFGYIRIKAGKRPVKAGLIVLLVFLLLYKGNALKIHVINVGQGDSIFIETPGGYTALIDTGPAFSDYSAAQSRVIPYIRKQGHNSIDMLVITHFHSDHAGGLEYLLKELKIGTVVAYGVPENENLEYTKVAAGDSISLDGMLLNILYPQPDAEEEGENESCLVMELVYGEYNMLLTADAERQVMDTLAGDYEVIKLPHHGSLASFSYTMADASRIGTAVVSVGRNSYGHPSSEVLDYLEEKGVHTYRTDTMGNITITTTGKNYRIVSQSP